MTSRAREAAPSRPARHARYLASLLARYASYYLPDGGTVLEIGRPHRRLRPWLRVRDVREVDLSGDEAAASEAWAAATHTPVDCIVLNGQLQYERDIQAFLERLGPACHAGTRVLVIFYSTLWKPLSDLATLLGWRTREPEENWLTPYDVDNLLRLAGFECVVIEGRVLCPVYIPLVSGFVNRWLAPLPGFRSLTLAKLAVARPLGLPRRTGAPSVSVVVPARNESGNIRPLLDRLPSLGPDDELIVVEGHSRDDTWATIQAVAAEHPERRIVALRQPGSGKGDAVRAGFARATRDILLILDADLTVAPEDLPKFYRAIASGAGEFINGSRLVYPMEHDAMQLANVVGNKFFAMAFSFLLGQPLKDTLCGTKVLWREDYERLARGRAYFGDFDPFGDFDLLFGASRQGLRILELPIRYRERTYGSTNIRRWAHGWLLLRMVAFAARKMKFL